MKAAGNLCGPSSLACLTGRLVRRNDSIEAEVSRRFDESVDLSTRQSSSQIEQNAQMLAASCHFGEMTSRGREADVLVNLEQAKRIIVSEMIETQNLNVRTRFDMRSFL
jgi:hypothetical protein